jgi:hypothetical protein
MDLTARQAGRLGLGFGSLRERRDQESRTVMLEHESCLSPFRQRPIPGEMGLRLRESDSGLFHANI